MTLISSDLGAPRRRFSSLSHAVRDWFAQERERRRRRHLVQDLARLPDHLIRDLGLEDIVPHRAPKIDVFWR